MIRSPIRKSAKAALIVCSLAVLVFGYQGLSSAQRRRNPNDTTLPGYMQLIEGVKEIATPQLRSGEVWLYEDAKASCTRFFLAVLVAVVLAVVIGTLMGCSAVAEAFFEAPVAIAGKLNPVAMLAVYFVLVGTGELMYVAIIVTGIFPPLATAIYTAIKYDIPAELIHKSYTLGASHFRVVLSVVLPFITPKILAGVRAQIGAALVFLMAAEMVVADAGFGFRIRLQSRLLDMKTVYPYICILATFGYLCDLSLRFLMAVWCPWYSSHLGNEIAAEATPSYLEVQES